MKNLKRAMSLLLTLIMVLGMLTACGGGKKEEAPKAEEPKAEEPAKEESKPAGPQYMFKYGAAAPASGIEGDGNTEQARLIGECTDGVIECTYYPSSQLGEKVAVMQGLQDGTIEMTTCAAPDLSSFSTMWDVISLPYLFDSGEQAVAVLNDPEMKAMIDADLAEEGFICIGWWSFGERCILNSKRPVTKPEDLKGISVRVLSTDVQIDSMNAMGASAMNLAWGEVYSALQTGAIDGVDNSIPVLTGDSMHEVAKYLSLTQEFITPNPILVSKKVFDSLTPELQAGILEAGATMADKWNNEIWAGAVEEQTQVMIDAGVEITEVDKDAFKAAVQPVVDKFIAGADAEQQAFYELLVKVREKY